MENSDDFSDELDEFEESQDDSNIKKKNKPYDEAYDVSQDLSMAESYDGRDKKVAEKEHKLQNDKYDEAVDVSQSIDQGNFSGGKDFKSNGRSDDIKSPEMRSIPRTSDQSRSHGVLNKPFDEALEFSQSGSDDSVDTKQSDIKTKSDPTKTSLNNESKLLGPSSSHQKPGGAVPLRSEANKQSHVEKLAPSKDHNLQGNGADNDESSSEDGDQEGSYENVVGAYNAKDFANLNVTPEIRDLFQHIERYKPHEVELESTLKCFIPEYIPAIGEMDAFIKVPRPDKKDEDLGLKFLDEPSSSQSDPTVLELQLRAMSKKLQYGDVVVRSIDNASKNPIAIEKWIQSISDLHRSRPPPQVHYKRHMPDIDSLLDVWPEEFEIALQTLKLPSPDLDLSLIEYVKTLCAILDIPVYENPVESLHQMFSLFMDFRNNPHLQARDYSFPDRDTANGGAQDIMNVDQNYYK